MKCGKLILLLSVTLVMAPILSMAEVTSSVLEGQIQQIVLSDGVLYVQATTVYPNSIVYRLDTDNPSLLLPVADGIKAEDETVFVCADNIYLFPSGSSKIELLKVGVSSIDAQAEIAVLPSQLEKTSDRLVPFLCSVSNENEITFIMAQGEMLFLCHTNILTSESKIINMEDNLFAFQQYDKEKSIVFRTNRETGSKDISIVDWSNLQDEPIGSLPANATSIAYDQENDAIYYIAEGNLICNQLNGESYVVVTGLPLWTDQRAFILEGGMFVTLYIDADESIFINTTTTN
ncbi:MAG: hypothetical protein RR505_11655 [Raoultibacter sp.]